MALPPVGQMTGGNRRGLHKSQSAPRAGRSEFALFPIDAFDLAVVTVFVLVGLWTAVLLWAKSGPNHLWTGTNGRYLGDVIQYLGSIRSSYRGHPHRQPIHRVRWHPGLPQSGTGRLRGSCPRRCQRVVVLPALDARGGGRARTLRPCPRPPFDARNGEPQDRPGPGTLLRLASSFPGQLRPPADPLLGVVLGRDVARGLALGISIDGPRGCVPYRNDPDVRTRAQRASANHRARRSTPCCAHGCSRGRAPPCSSCWWVPRSTCGSAASGPARPASWQQRPWRVPFRWLTLPCSAISTRRGGLRDRSTTVFPNTPGSSRKRCSP